MAAVLKTYLLSRQHLKLLLPSLFVMLYSRKGEVIIASYTAIHGFNCSFIRKTLLSGKGGTWIQKSGKGGTQAKKD